MSLYKKASEPCISTILGWLQNIYSPHASRFIMPKLKTQDFGQVTELSRYRSDSFPQTLRTFKRVFEDSAEVIMQAALFKPHLALKLRLSCSNKLAFWVSVRCTVKEKQLSQLSAMGL
mmetsp:Transcript_669/g.1194  ORF Transcript_669/g.1194 Transcript_669/m.1194 type:complete len:118 (-) Transcript_669:1288-1641(-)